MQIENPREFRKNIVSNLNKFIKSENISINLEKAVFNYSIKTSREKKIVKKWNNEYFVQVYLDRLRSIINNINPTYKKNNKNLLKKL